MNTVDHPRPASEGSVLAAYEEQRELGLNAARMGNLPEARIAFKRAAEIAADLDDDRIQNRAFCNVALIEIEMGNSPESLIPRLRTILVDNECQENCRLAAYHLARIYELRHEYKKGLFYARVAQERSERTQISEWVASSCNQMGNLLIGECEFSEAEGQLERALDLMPDDDSVPRALILDNLGYCRLVQGEIGTGFRCLFEGLRILRRLGAEGRLSELHLSLCFGYLEISRWKRAALHGAKGLQLAEAHGDQTGVKNALFLLGEIFSQAGDLDKARDYFLQLQEDFFPDHHFLPDFLLGVDVRGLVNLKA